YMIEHGGELTEIYLSDMVRVPYLNYLVIFFVVFLILIGRIQGIKSLVALGLTIIGVYKILLPALLKGMSPLFITILISLAVTLATMIIVAGLTKKAFAATMGTIGGVLVAGLLALIVSKLAYLTGYASEESRMLLYVDGLNINMQGLLLAGIIIGALGATMDVAISIASSIEEIRKANPELPMPALMRAGLNVGRDIMGTMTNTLILAYAGGALPLLMLFMAYATPSVSIFNSELIATEIVRALTGSIGLIFSVPITAFIASLLSANRR
ncbi:MAG: YibE/F family protein, partial [Syntrophomonadaceae bacterium]|nr:YibE/F family protein [Syntrophomonadaceae bacterium]